MVKISNYRINTDFTAVKQLPQTYNLNLVCPEGDHGFAQIFETSVNVPSGRYIENVLISHSADGYVAHLASELTHFVDQYNYFSITLDQANNTTYRLRVIFRAPSGSAYFPEVRANASLKLLLSPFS